MTTDQPPTQSPAPSAGEERRNLIQQYPWLLVPGMLMWVFFGLGYWAQTVAEKGDAAARVLGMDPASASSMCFIVGAVFLILSVGLVGGLVTQRKRAIAKKQSSIRQDGVPARARILGLKETGARTNRNPWVELELEIIRVGVDSYRVTTEALISTLAIPRVQPDCVIDVRVDPHDPQQIVIEESLAP